MLFFFQTYLRLHHCRPLRSQYPHRLEHVQHALVLHSLQYYAERDEHPGPTDTGTTVHRNRAILAELLLRFMHLSDEIDEAFARFWHSLLWPVDELELPHRPRRTVPRIGHFELAKFVLRHVVLSNGVDHVALVPHRTLVGPVLETFLLL